MCMFVSTSSMSKEAEEYITQVGDFWMERLQSEAQLLRVLSAKVEQRFAQFDDLAHGWEHVQRVYTTALYLAEQEGADRFIVGVAALMHDLGRTVHENGGDKLHHADLSVNLARVLLTEHDIPLDKQEAIVHAI